MNETPRQAKEVADLLFVYIKTAEGGVAVRISDIVGAGMEESAEGNRIFAVRWANKARAGYVLPTCSPEEFAAHVNSVLRGQRSY